MSGKKKKKFKNEKNKPNEIAKEETVYRIIRMEKRRKLERM